MALSSRLASLAQRELLMVTGKGGVGKTAVSAVLGLALSRAGRRVLVVEVDPRENLHQMLGVPPSGGAVVPAGPRLWVQNLKPAEVLDEVVREQVRIELIVRRVLASDVYKHFAAAAPGLKELAILGHALRLLRGRERGAPALDLVILDAPATGHGVSLLAAPQLVSEVIRSGPFGRLAGELAAWLADPGRCGIAVVTQAEEMPVEEALELRAALRERLDRSPELLVINGLYPPFPAVADAAMLPPADDALTSLWRRRRALNDRELARLRARWEGPAIELPQLPIDRGPALVAALADRLEARPN
ncbi:MAG TPA: ArsA family ATPase [Thermoanaerobaculia bacterium]|nr:ArsA family ATPase [Thermoanaerobaculia bacterium]